MQNDNSTIYREKKRKVEYRFLFENWHYFCGIELKIRRIYLFFFRVLKYILCNKIIYGGILLWIENLLLQLIQDVIYQFNF